MLIVYGFPLVKFGVSTIRLIKSPAHYTHAAADKITPTSHFARKESESSIPNVSPITVLRKRFTQTFIL